MVCFAEAKMCSVNVFLQMQSKCVDGSLNSLFLVGQMSAICAENIILSSFPISTDLYMPKLIRVGFNFKAIADMFFFLLLLVLLFC